MTPHDNSKDQVNWDLLPLTPKYIEAEHGHYVSAISTALADHKVRNIALSGNYGVGKSSILQKITELEAERVVELSLSTLAPIDMTVIDKSVPIQATTPTNRIQQEIVKQLLYREKPEKTAGSRFRRIERFRLRREAMTAAIVAFVVALVFLLAGWGETIALVLTLTADRKLWVYPVVFVITTIAIVVLRALLHGRVHIRAFSAGPAAVTLDEHSVSYFDQYLDEIVYFFETSDYDIVIFEDIDRFNNSHIFETLRSLNTLLNAAPQIDRPIRFVYAIKDSIFDRIGLETEGRKDALLTEIKDPATLEAIRANRTKFFDLVIPVVPFITHRSARNLASQLLGDLENDVSPDLIDLGGRFVPDMRLLKNVRNEFVVFRDRIFSGDGGALNLSETDLFAMMLYKSTHLSDFESIRLGTSNLDKLYATSRALVSGSIRRLERERRATRREMTRNMSAPVRAAQMGDLLVAHIERTARATGIHLQSQQYALSQSPKSVDELKSLTFWREFGAAPSGAAIVWRNVYGQSMSFSREDLVAALGDGLDADRWLEADQQRLNEVLEEQREQLAFLRSADIGALMQRPEFTVDFEGSEQSLESITDHLLTRGLAFHLIREGFINRNFTLYTSTFHGDRVSSSATNFIIHHIERDEMDVHFVLAGEDVDAVVRERGASALGEPALFNIAILDHLLKTSSSNADVMIASLARLHDPALVFLQAYLTASTQLHAFLARFVARCDRALNYLVSQAELEDDVRVQLVSDALANLAPGIKYNVDESTSRFLNHHCFEFPALLSDQISPEGASRIGVVFTIASLKFAELTPFSANIQEALVARNLYVITRSNLEVAVRGGTGLSLDAIRATNKNVYRYVMDNLAAYIASVDGYAPTNDAADGLIVTIEDVLKHDADQLDEVVARSSDQSRVSDIASVPEAAWSALARSARFPATFSNVTQYIAMSGAIDGDLAEVLKVDCQIDGHADASESEKVELAQVILAARAHLHSTLRVPLVVSLRLAQSLDASSIEAENSPLFALLLQSKLVDDDSRTYDHNRNIDWKWREELIAVSSNFKDYMTPEVVGGDLENLLLSPRIGKLIKLATLDAASEYSRTTNDAGRREMARFALANGRGLPLGVVEGLPNAGANASTVVELLAPHLDTIDNATLFAILRVLDGPYAKLTSVGYERPKLDNTTANRALLTSLEQRQIVSKFDIKGRSVVVYKKHKN